MAVLGSLKKKRAPRRKTLRGRSYNLPDFSWMRDPELPECSNNMVYTPNKNFFDQTRNESKRVQQEIDHKLKSSAPVCNKGAYMYIGASTDLTAVGRKK